MFLEVMAFFWLCFLQQFSLTLRKTIIDLGKVKEHEKQMAEGM